MKKVVVTGGSGKAGRAVVNELNAGGYQTLNVDQTIPPASWGWALAVDLTDLGQTIEALKGADAVVHLAAIPAPEMRPEQETFRNNILSTYNVFSAAVDLGLEKVVWASSETVLGLPFEKELPDYAPIDEQQTPFPESSYALSKLLGEQMAAQFYRRFGMPFAGLRISNIMEPDEYAKFPTFWDDPGAAQVEPLGIRRRPRRRPGRSPGAGTRRPRLRAVHRRRRRHGDGPLQQGPHGRGLPHRRDPPRPRRVRNPPVDRQGPRGPRLRTRPHLARPPVDTSRQSSFVSPDGPSPARRETTLSAPPPPAATRLSRRRERQTN